MEASLEASLEDSHHSHSHSRASASLLDTATMSWWEPLLLVELETFSLELSDHQCRNTYLFQSASAKIDPEDSDFSQR
jgi:hypothetical protein